MKKLYVNGCSHTEGTKLSLDDMKQAWPYKLKEMLNVDMYNESCTGVSNDRIFRSTIATLSTIDWKPDLVIIQWTHPDRFEVPHDKMLGKEYEKWGRLFVKGWRQLIPRVFLNKYGEYNSAHKEFALDGLTGDFIHKYYDFEDNLYTKQVLWEKELIQIIAMQSFLKLKNIDYIFIVWENWQYAFPDMIHEYYSAIDTSKILNYDDDIIWGMNHILKSYNFKLSKKIRECGTPDKHFMADAHLFQAEALYNFIEYGTKLTPNTTIDRPEEEIFRYD